MTIMINSSKITVMYVSTCYVAQNIQLIYESKVKLYLGRVALSAIQDWYQKELCNGSS